MPASPAPDRDTGPFTLLPAYEAYNRADFLPSSRQLGIALAGNDAVTQVIAPENPALLYAVMGGGYSAEEDGSATTYSTIIDVAFDPTRLAGGNLILGALDPLSSGNGFDSLHFRVDREGVTVLDVSVFDLVSALTLFNDHLFDLGDWSSGLDGNLDLRFSLDVTASRPGDAFYMNFVATTVPLPGSIFFLGTALAGLLQLKARNAQRHGPKPPRLPRFAELD